MAELYGQRIQTTVQTKYLPFVVDTVLNSNVLLQRFMRGAKKWGGRTLRVPVKVSKNVTGQSFAGFQTFSTAATDNRQFMEYTPAFYQITCALPGDELSVADTEDKILDLIKLTIQSDTEDMADDLGTIFYAAQSGTDPNGLGNLVDDGTTAGTIGGLSRTTYETLKSTVTSSSGTLTLAKVDTLWNAVSSGAQVPTLVYTTEAVFSLFGQLLRPQERITKTVSRVKGMVGSTGFTGLEYNGKEIVKDEKCTSGAFIMLNENYLDWYALPAYGCKPIAYKNQIEGNDYETPVGLGFSWSDWIKAQNAYSFVGHIYVGGQFVITNPKRSGKLTAITGI